MKIIVSAGKKEPYKDKKGERIQFTMMEVHATIEYDPIVEEQEPEILLKDALERAKDVIKEFSFDDPKKEYKFDKLKSEPFMRGVDLKWTDEEILNKIKVKYSVSDKTEKQIINFLTKYRDGKISKT